MFPTRRLMDLPYEGESRMREFSLNRGSVGATDRENFVYATSQDANPDLPPFLRNAIEKDRPRRNYYVEPGGRMVITDGPVPFGTATATKRLYSAPVSQVSFGGESVPGYPGFRTQG